MVSSGFCAASLIICAESRQIKMTFEKNEHLTSRPTFCAYAARKASDISQDVFVKVHIMAVLSAQATLARPEVQRLRRAKDCGCSDHPMPEHDWTQRA